MAEPSHEMLDAFEKRLAAPDFDEVENIRAAFKILPHHDTYGTPPADICLRFLDVMDQMVVYRPALKIEMAHNYSNADWIKAIAIGNIEGLLRGGEFWRRKKPHALPLTPQQILAALPNWSDTAHDTHPLPAENYFRALENQSDSLAGALKLVIEKNELKNVFPKGTERAIYATYKKKEKLKSRSDWPDQLPLSVIQDDVLPLLDGEHSVTRNLGGALLGTIYGLGNEEDIRKIGAPSHTEMLHFITEKHRANGDILGSFIKDARLEIEDLSIFDDWPLADDFDWRRWIIDAACEFEPDDSIIGEPLWFPIHEHFYRDLDVVMQLIDHKRYFMAKMTAEEGWLPHMKVAVERLAALDDPIAAEARYSLAHYWPKRNLS